MLSSIAVCVLSISPLLAFAAPRPFDAQRLNPRAVLTETQVFLQTLTSTSTETVTSTGEAESVTSSTAVASASSSPDLVTLDAASASPLATTFTFLSQTESLVSPSASSPQVTPSTASDSSTTDTSLSQSSTSSGPETILFLPPDSSGSTANSLSPTTSTTVLPSPTVSPASDSSVAPLQGPIVAAYYPDWVLDTLPPENIDFSRFDWIDYAFTWPAQNFSLLWDSDDSPAILQRLVTATHANGKKVKLSVGGWDGGMYFSSACSNSTNRQTFADNIAETYEKYDLDGIDIDWEYPGETGHAGNQESPDDTSDFLSFLQVLRSTLPAEARITAAAQVFPFVDPFGAPSKNISAFADVLDWILLENYDTWGSSSDPGPNAPLSDGCNNSTQPQSNAVAAVEAWTSSDFPASKLMLGVPSYGYINAANTTSLQERRSMVSPRLFKRAKSASDHSPLKLKSEDDNSSSEGQIQFNQLVMQGALNETSASSDSSVSSYVGAGGFTRYFDNCSSTPYLVSPAADQVITYDDPHSLEMKATYAYQAGLLGVEMFDVSGDTNQWDLTDGLRRGLGVI